MRNTRLPLPRQCHFSQRNIVLFFVENLRFNGFFLFDIKIDEEFVGA